MGPNAGMPHPQQPIMNQANFPPVSNATMPPNPQTFAAQPQAPATPQIQQIRFPEVNIQELHAMTDRSEKLKFVGNAIYFPIHDVHGEMAGKITGCLLDGVAEFERLVLEPEFLNRNVHDVYCLLMQQQQAAQVMQQQMTQVPTDMGGMPQPTPQVPDMPPTQQ